MKIFVKFPGKKPEEMEIENTVRCWQQILGEDIETMKVTDDFILLCNEVDGAKHCEVNARFLGMQFYGPIAFCGMENGSFSDVPIDYAAFKRIMPDEWWEE